MTIYICDKCSGFNQAKNEQAHLITVNNKPFYICNKCEMIAKSQLKFIEAFLNYCKEEEEQ